MATGVLIAGGVAAFLAWPAIGIVGQSDFDQLWYAARALLTGGNPYGAVGPGRAFDSPFPLFYPLPGVLAAVPFTLLTPAAASMLFSGISAALFAWALIRKAPYRLLALLSFSFYYAAAISQWSPLLVAAALIPGLGFLFAVKPTIGFALWLYRPRWEAVVGGGALLLLSFAVRPQWFAEWSATFSAGTHIRSPVTMLGGPLILIALLRWRRPEARLLVALACVPHTTLLYEALPLFLVPTSWAQSLLLLLLNWAAEITVITLGPYDALIDRARMNGVVAIALLYIPCVIMILRRPNEGPVPAWLDWGAARAATTLSRFPLARRAVAATNALMQYGSGKISLRRPRSGAH